MPDILNNNNHYKKKMIALITDFGNKDYFIGTLKGVINQISPHTEIVDISNDIPSFSILPASFALEKTFPFFPKNTVFLVVVDPGVGSDRNMLLVEYDEQFFIAPDNGLLTPVLKEGKKTVYYLDNKNYFLTNGYSTFEARDKMAPAAAYLSTGVDPKEMGTLTSQYIMNEIYFPTTSGEAIEGTVVYIDKYGNVMTNVPADFLFDFMGKQGKKNIKMTINNKQVNAFYDTYSSASDGVFMLIGSHGNLEVAQNRDSAKNALGAEIGQPVRIEFY